ncbi:hypothetical protein COY32_04720 [candidate division WWE3 bacterium CG_4_10_14_0_2_um_filter_41_14]|uniref:UDP-N-acetylglucosamine 1-carboxyvinyltransferase n=1 Tax=candidate division WWE3 bacterium CG_4_10_14_0_2_um_filter_41_14 TaxID=1975072 RepID=A0A2M7THS2_UNCKA|nr:MAG: hypothetical protein COY32_04720 [candidate division WWE3 bacterium CG_4_10_14_0_2_um_filter_41_14]
MRETVTIVGGKKLTGEVYPIPNKNAIVAALPASILCKGTTVFHSVPDTSDVTKILLIIEKLGGVVENDGNGTVTINGESINSYKVDQKLGSAFRASLNFVGPLLARFGVAQVPQPGGCELGMRSIEAHTNAFSKLGVSIELINDYILFTAPKVKEKTYRVWQIEASVTATENIVMYAAGIASDVQIIDAACEPHVTDVVNLLKDMGADIQGVGSNQLHITGVEDMQGADFTPRPDFVDITGYMIAAAITDGEITIKGGNLPDVVDGIINWMVLFNVQVDRVGDDLLVKRGDGGLTIADVGFPQAAKNLPKFVPRPWPGFPVDCVPPMAVLASKSEGRLLLQNWMYESGLDFVRELNFLGADILMLDPQKIIVKGPVMFAGGDVTPPLVIQSMKAVFLAALCEPVETTIHGFDILKRRYPNIIEVYQKLGAQIQVVTRGAD